jgi:hypothetical protein
LPDRSDLAVEQRSNRPLRRFGLTVAIGFAILGAISAYRGHTIAPRLLWALATALFVFGLFLPVILKPVERVWLGLATALAWINTRVILSFLFYAVFAPIGLVRRLIRDPLDRELHDGSASYWIRKETKPFDPKSYENQF